MAVDLSGFDLLQTAILLLDEAGMIRHVNSAAEELFGLSRRQLAGQPAARYLELLTSVQKTPLHEQPWAWLIEIPTLQALRLGDPQQSSGAAQRESLRNLAHEVRNPLAGLRAAAQLLEMELPREDLRDYTRVIVAEADRLANLVDRLTSSRAPAAEPRAFNVHRVCDRVLSLIGMEFGPALTIVRDYDASVPEIRADRDRLLQALLNVARNGAQALMEGARVRRPELRVRTRVMHQLPLPTGSRRMGLCVAVIDNGPGVPEALRDRIFHPLVTGRAAGTGLGLSLAQEILQQLGGVLEFDSRVGHTEFRLLLPLEPT